MACNAFHLDVSELRAFVKKGLLRAIQVTDGEAWYLESQLESLLRQRDGKSSQFRVLRNAARVPFSVVELFAGAGGLALGFENAGLETRLLVEIDKNAAATLRLNRKKWDVRECDVGSVNFRGIQADVVAGGFPCQAFSYAGKRLGFEDTRGTLFFQFARAINEIQPRVIVGENVRGLERHDSGRTLATMLNVLDELGYAANYKVLRSQYFDVPQKRERLVIIGVRKDLGLSVAFPKERDYVVTLRSALKGVPKSVGQLYTEQKRRVMERVPEGGYWRDLPVSIQKKYMGASFHLGGGKTGMARRLRWDEPSLTLTCNPAQKQTERCHPSETRPLTVREYARIQSFPDDWQFSGSVAAQYKQIGNAVPVNLGYYIGRAVIASLSGRDDETVEIFPQMLL
jgi:DNA (cytosine-5)-methyltransferase 1